MAALLLLLLLLLSFTYLIHVAACMSAVLFAGEWAMSRFTYSPAA
jgi:hypothetical protein